MSRKYSIVILGAGIKGAADAYVLSQHSEFDIQIVDPNPGRGTSGKSDGRIHSGGTGLKYDGPDILRRKLIGGTTMVAAFPDALQTTEPAVYGYADGLSPMPLLATAAMVGISVKKVIPPEHIRSWFPAEVLEFYSFPEFAFNPAKFTGRLLTTAEHRGVRIVSKKATTAQRDFEGRWEIKFTDTTTIKCDIVINALGSGMRGVLVEGEYFLPENISIESWPIAAVQANKLPRLDRILVTVDPDVRMASVVKHGEVLAVDTKPKEIKTIQRPEDLPIPNPRPYNQNDVVELYMIEELKRRYPPLNRLSDDDFGVVYCSHIRTRPDPMRPEQRHRTESDIIMIRQVLPNYFQHIGGMATTSLIDALEVDKVLREALQLPVLDLVSALSRLNWQLDADDRGIELLYEEYFARGGRPPSAEPDAAPDRDSM